MDVAVYKTRRQRLLQQLSDTDLVILATAPEVIRNGDTDFPYRPHSDFYYLTGFDEPEAFAVLAPGSQEPYLLFVRPRDPEQERWTGTRTGVDGAVTHYQADVAYPVSEFYERLPKLLKGRNTVHLTIGLDTHLERTLLGHIATFRGQTRRGETLPQALVNLDKILHEMRIFKDEGDIAQMRVVTAATASAHQRLMRSCRPGQKEYQLQAEFLHEIHQFGCQQIAYSTIVAGGENACILHYTRNTDVLQDGQLVLVDAGGEYDYYAGDVTRTFPVNGKFTPEQKAVYEIVLAAQAEVIAMAKPGVPWNALQEKTIAVLSQGLIELGVLKFSLDQIIEHKLYAPYYPHNVSHWLGMDVHDVGIYKPEGSWRPIAANMILTVEPGLYFSSANPEVKPAFKGIGIRIEDDILVTHTGNEVLTKNAVKSIADIEALMSHG